jgi:biopolymer transport protein ExbB/TolQ
MLIERLERVALMGSAWVLYLLIALSVVSITITFERVSFFLRHRDDVDSLGDRLVALLRRGDLRGAKELLARSRSIEAKVIAPTLEWLEGGPKAVSEAIEAELGKQRRALERGMTFLGTLGNNAPFIGLFGTVLGVIQAFHQLGDAQNKAGMGNVMAAIAEALVATGVGLVVAIPAVVAYNAAQKNAGEIEANVAILAKRLLALLEYQAKIAADWRGIGEHEAHREALREAAIDRAGKNGAVAHELD